MAAAAAAAIASWVPVVQARKIAQEARDAEAEAMLALLLVSLNFNLPSVGQPTMGVALFNASEDLSGHRPTNLLRGEDRLY